MMDTTDVLVNLKDGEVVVLELEQKELAVMTNDSYSNIQRDYEEMEGTIEYLIGEVELLYSHLHDETIPDNLNSAGRIPSSDIINHIKDKHEKL